MVLTCLTNKLDDMEDSQTLLANSTNEEKGAYLGAIASLATVDRQATEDEIEYLKALAEAAQLSDEQAQAVITAATEISTEDVKRCLDVLKNSELKYSFITDLIAFAKSDHEYSEQEQHYVQQMAQHLGIEQNQFSLLDSFAEKATTAQNPQEVSSPNFLSSTGLKGKLESAGINGDTLLKGLLGIAAPLILSKMMTGGLNQSRRGGMFGGGGFGGGMLGGGLGSLIGMLSGGRGMGSMGGLFGGLFGGRRGW
jgi:uncharacterized tellurite resistance protein B-like protein